MKAVKCELAQIWLRNYPPFRELEVSVSPSLTVKLSVTHRKTPPLVFRKHTLVSCSLWCTAAAGLPAGVVPSDAADREDKQHGSSGKQQLTLPLAQYPQIQEDSFKGAAFDWDFNITWFQWFLVTKPKCGSVRNRQTVWTGLKAAGSVWLDPSQAWNPLECWKWARGDCWAPLEQHSAVSTLWMCMSQPVRKPSVHGSQTMLCV